MTLLAVHPDHARAPAFRGARVLRRAAARTWLLAGTLLLCAWQGPTAALTAEVDEFELPIEAALEQRLLARTAGEDDALALFYQRRGYSPAWDDGERVAQLVELFDSSAVHGLDAADFSADAVHAAAAAPASPALAARVERELLFSASLLRFAYQLRYGKLDPRRLYPQWNHALPPPTLERAQLLESLLAAPALPAALAAQLPAAPRYQVLQHGLAAYRALTAAGGWAPLADGQSLRRGDRGARVAALRARLWTEHGALPFADAAADFGLVATPERFDDALASAVRAFQRRHNMADDAVVGAQTLAALNVSAQARADQLRVNLERLRWVASDLRGDRVEVDLTAFRAALIIDEQPRWSTRVIVGRPTRATPVLLDRVEYVVLNPKWVVPPTILREDVLPRLASDPGYLARERMRLLDRSGQTIDPESIDWINASPARAAFRVVQDAGADGSLGVVKFALSNDHAIFLHDTNARRQFARSARALSSGCVRVEHPIELARLLLSTDAPERWAGDAVDAALASGRTRTIPLQHEIRVLLSYFTAAVADDGELQFRADIYQHDAEVLAALRTPAAIYAKATRR